MTRRDFITVLGGVVAWPPAARAQQGDRVRRIGVLMSFGLNDPEGLARIVAFAKGLQGLGWTVGRNLRIDTRWIGGDTDRAREYAAELVALPSDVIVANGVRALEPSRQATSTVPIVMVNVPDPVGGGYVASLARPGGNVTGFMQSEYSMSAKWPELLKEIDPRVTRAAVIRDPTITAGVAQFAVIQSVAGSLGVELSPIDTRDNGGIERGVTAFARAPNGGLIVTTAGSASPGRRELIIALAARYRLPGVYPYRYDVTDGGLISYGPDIVDQYRRAAVYVDRILRGEKPADLPVQAPTKYELVINLKTARALGLTVPPTLLARADEVIE